MINQNAKLNFRRALNRFRLLIILILIGVVIGMAWYHLYSKFKSIRKINSLSKEYDVPKFEAKQKKFSNEEILAAIYSDYHYNFTNKEEYGSYYLKKSGSNDNYICFINKDDALIWMNNNISEVALNVWSSYYSAEKIKIKSPKIITKTSLIDFEIDKENTLADGTLYTTKELASALNCNYFDTRNHDHSADSKGILKVPINIENVRYFTEYYWRALKKDEKILNILDSENSKFIVSTVYSAQRPSEQYWSPKNPLEQVFLVENDISIDKKSGETYIVPKVLMQINGAELIHAEIQ